MSNMAKKVAAAAVIAAALAASSLGAGGAMSSSPLAVNFSSDATAFWRTVDARTPLPLQWEWPDGAATAAITASGAGTVAFSQQTFTRPVSNTVATFSVPQSRRDEDVQTLTLTFRDAQDALLSDKTLTAQLGVVKGMGIGHPTVVRFDAAQQSGNKVSRNIVLPIPAGATELVLDGIVTPTGLSGAAGWFLWEDIPVGLHSAILQTPDGVSSNNAVYRVQDGTVIIAL